MLSCDVGCVKPDKAIYLAALERLDVTPDKALFVDDKLVYCDGARALGLTAVQIDRRDESTAGAVRSLLDVSAFL